jgi:hypothetical protein
MSSFKSLYSRLLDEAYQKTLIKEEESDNQRKLVDLLITAIDSYNPNLTDKDFARAVASILKLEYGTHNYGRFLEELQDQLRSN